MDPRQNQISQRFLPPLYKLSDIYKSITKRALELELDKFLAHTGSRALRVVTVCSGTESPLLALEMVQENLRKHFDRNFEFRHLFSAEIVPFKQAYIERNFHPPFIFRDIAELKDRVAQTAYGSLEKIPKDADILIAGFSCVDFSALNSRRKTLDDKGESGGTFWGIIRYAHTYRPRMVILENVKTAPWDTIEKHWNEIDYFAVHVDVDTKAYYLPQTRERGYMFCVDKRLMDKYGMADEDMLRWTDVLADFKRPASSPAGMFIMEADDWRLEQVEKDMAVRITSSSSSSRATVNWAKYQVRHQSYRLNQSLGHRRPVSKSQDDGTCQMPDFAWQTWVRSLPERVWDTIDVNFLRKLVEGYDMNYKERCIELSQGLDREIDSRAYGIVGCITPCGIPYITTRGGPLCGLESLALQGLPLDRLLLTRESQRELQDLAGNAMSSTVVGCAVLSALIVGYKLLDKGAPIGNTKRVTPKSKALAPRDNCELVLSNFSESSKISLRDLQAQASASARYYCAGNPEHAYERWTDLIRTEPLDFVSKLKELLPTRLVVSGITSTTFDPLKGDASIMCSADIWNDFLDAVMRAVGDELRFLDIKRTDVWTVLYEGKYATLDLILAQHQVDWFLYAKPLDSEPALCLNREILSKPFAHMTPGPNSLLEGEWEVCAPLSTNSALVFSRSGTLVPSYEAKCGLAMKEFRDSKVWTKINVGGSVEDVQYLKVDIRGTYELLPDCGTANACLHKKAATKKSPAVYLFLDPTKLGEPVYDSFVFSLDHRRIAGYAARLTIAEVSHRWRSARSNQDPELINVYYRKWTKASYVTLEPYSPTDSISCYHLKPGANISISNGDCHHANTTLLSFTYPAAITGGRLEKGMWEVLDPIDSPELLKEFSWLLQKAASFSEFQDWSNVIHKPSEESTTEDTLCSVCVPPKPRILWGRNGRGWVKAYEDPRDAALYERQIKARPRAFLVFHNVEENDIGELQVTLNIQSLLHQAHEKLRRSGVVGEASFRWRLVPNAYDSRDMAFPTFELTSNRNDTQATQPPGFQLDLRPEQLRSLAWMIKQEDEAIGPFVEEETEEALLPQLMWRAEARVTVPTTVRGGVLADDVGYGKTAIILGLVDSQFERSIQSTPDAASGLIPTNATLIIVPQIMLRQWQSEVEKFLGPKYNVLVFKTHQSLAASAIREIQDADIILVSWSVFKNPSYYNRMQKFTGMPRAPTKGGRNFDDWFEAARVALGEQVQILMSEGPESFLDNLRTKRQTVNEHQEHSVYVPSKRLRGQRYADFHQTQEQEADHGVQYAEISGAEDSAPDDEDPVILREKVDQLIRRRPHQSCACLGIGQEVSEDESDEVTDCDESSSESPAKGKNTETKGARKRGQPTKKSKAWNDRKEFNITEKGVQDWTFVRTPVLHAFMFNRLVIDEFTYADSERLSPLLALQARSKWVLSGTPPLNDFADVKTIAPFLGIHLGVDEDDEQSQNKRLKILHRQRSDAETFQSFRAPRSQAWHRNRHEVAQRFLNQFARRNIAEIDEIPFTEHVILVPQSPAETAIYLELYKQLMTCNRQLRRSGGRSRLSSDQVERLDEIIGSSSTAEEALLKRCASLALQGRWDKGKPEATTCKSLIELRGKQLADLKEDLLMKLKMAACIYCGCDLRYESFHKFVESILRHDFGDMEVTKKAYPLLKRAILQSEKDDWKLFFAPPNSAKDDLAPTDKCRPHESDEDDSPEQTKKAKISKDKQVTGGKVKAVKTDHTMLPKKPTRPKEYDAMMREATTAIRKLVVEWVLRERALRFLRTVRHVQTRSTPVKCDSCGDRPPKLDDVQILGSCGHALCPDCISEVSLEECAVKGCRGSRKKFNIINASTLGCDKDRSTRFGGTKMDKLVQIVGDIPTNERALLFIQFPELIDIASKALDMAGVKHIAICATDRTSAQKVEQFQKTSFGDNKVLVLNLGSEMAAGLNLQCANHVIFLSPMLAQTQYDYDSAMTQAIGRCRRYGQTKHVHIYHLLAKRTIDVNLFQERRGKVLVERKGAPFLVNPDEADESEAMSCQGPSLVVDNAF
ncbi:C-5 cytosine-specific DNA methylase [Aspergillus terreus]|uniref:C-5 cytosine-specific DNA methylase n=1 Tax=Aspergillus terreus TaxID=33178 RepID=A0A5M3ZDK6_ASPTE|nr:hypothetical protein ATETN484_0014037400 [Aspergillus terreus]GFF21040.1 C-5 cytosine-specific DNA methylase [Aspergillus terreus]